MKGGPAYIRDQRALQSGIDDQRRRADRMEQEDVICDSSRRLVLRSPDGHYWAVTVSNAGALQTTDLGTTPYG